VSPPPGSPPPEFFGDSLAREIAALDAPRPPSPPPEFTGDSLAREIAALAAQRPPSPPPEFSGDALAREIAAIDAARQPTPPRESSPIAFARDAALDAPRPHTPGFGTVRFAGEYGEIDLPLPAADRAWLRPDSPTYRRLQGNALLEIFLGRTQGPGLPSSARPMTGEEAQAAHLFRSRLASSDPEGRHRRDGEYGQAFHRENGRLVPTGPLLYQPGEAIWFPPEVITPGTAQIIHSHPGDPEYHGPSDADYLQAYRSSRGNTGSLAGEMIYHPGMDRFFHYAPRLDPATGNPGYRMLLEPGESFGPGAE
jgi:hypothetical protein